jgi:hypothetical protein
MEVESGQLSGGTQGNYVHETPVKVVEVLTEIRTKPLPDTSLERYFYTNQLALTN